MGETQLSWNFLRLRFARMHARTPAPFQGLRSFSRTARPHRSFSCSTDAPFVPTARPHSSFSRSDAPFFLSFFFRPCMRRCGRAGRHHKHASFFSHTLAKHFAPIYFLTPHTCNSLSTPCAHCLSFFQPISHLKNLSFGPLSTSTPWYVTPTPCTYTRRGSTSARTRYSNVLSAQTSTQPLSYCCARVSFTLT